MPEAAVLQLYNHVEYLNNNNFNIIFLIALKLCVQVRDLRGPFCRTARVSTGAWPRWRPRVMGTCRRTSQWRCYSPALSWLWASWCSGLSWEASLLPSPTPSHDVSSTTTSCMLWRWVFSSQQTRNIQPMLLQCWPIVFDADPTLYRHWLNVSCLLGCDLLQILGQVKCHWID